MKKTALQGAAFPSRVQVVVSTPLARCGAGMQGLGAGNEVS